MCGPHPQRTLGFRRLTPKQSVGLKHVGLVITVKDVIKTNGVVSEIQVTSAPMADKKPKVRSPFCCIYQHWQAFIHWVSSSSDDKAPRKAEVRKYKPLFNVEKPSGKEEEVTFTYGICLLTSYRSTRTLRPLFRVRWLTVDSTVCPGITAVSHHVQVPRSETAFSSSALDTSVLTRTLRAHR